MRAMLAKNVGGRVGRAFSHPVIPALLFLVPALLWLSGCSGNKGRAATPAVTAEVLEAAAEHGARSPRVADAKAKPAAGELVSYAEEKPAAGELVADTEKTPTAEPKPEEKKPAGETKPAPEPKGDEKKPAAETKPAPKSEEKKPAAEAKAAAAETQKPPAPTVTLQLGTAELLPGAKLNGLISGNWGTDVARLLWVDAAGRVLADYKLEPAREESQTEITFSLERPAVAIGQKHQLVLVRATKQALRKAEKEPTVFPFRVEAQASFRVLPPPPEPDG
jgi:hypothetical protein